MDSEITYSIRTIARVKNDFPSKFGIPRQGSCIPHLLSQVIFEPEYRSLQSCKGLKDFSHLWLIWGFSQNRQEGWTPTVRPPRLGGNTHMGVFATRSPFRPNPIGLSCVKLEKILTDTPDAPVLVVSGADLMNGTPVFDIKPYIPYCDCFPDARGGFTENLSDQRLAVRFSSHCDGILSQEEKELLSEILSYDPRPRYHKDPNRIYGMPYSRYDVRFQVSDGILTVTDLKITLANSDNIQ